MENTLFVFDFIILFYSKALQCHENQKKMCAFSLTRSKNQTIIQVMKE